jgi:hypothetical protein
VGNRYSPHQALSRARDYTSRARGESVCKCGLLLLLLLAQRAIRQEDLMLDRAPITHSQALSCISKVHGVVRAIVLVVALLCGVEGRFNHDLLLELQSKSESNSPRALPQK